MSPTTKAWLSLLFIAIAWGTTYLAIKIGVTYVPSFLYAGIRQVAAGLILLAFAVRLGGKPDLSARNLKMQLLIGFLMITLGNGLVSWGEKYIPSGVAALICAMMPVFGVLINVVIHKSERLNLLIIGGMLLGLAGVAVNFRSNLADFRHPAYLGGIIATFCATTSWALGSIIGKRNKSRSNPAADSGLQLLFGGLLMLAISPAADDYRKADLLHPQALWALLYLVTIGSVLAYSAYMYALKQLPAGIVMTYAYVNPLVAVVLGWWWLGEALTWDTGLSFLAIVAGVYIVNRGYQQEQQRAVKEAGAVL